MTNYLDINLPSYYDQIYSRDNAQYFVPNQKEMTEEPEGRYVSKMEVTKSVNIETNTVTTIKPDYPEYQTLSGVQVTTSVPQPMTKELHENAEINNHTYTFPDDSPEDAGKSVLYNRVIIKTKVPEQTATALTDTVTINNKTYEYPDENHPGPLFNSVKITTNVNEDTLITNHKETYTENTKPNQYYYITQPAGERWNPIAVAVNVPLPTETTYQKWIDSYSNLDLERKELPSGTVYNKVELHYTPLLVEENDLKKNPMFILSSRETLKNYIFQNIVGAESYATPEFKRGRGVAFHSAGETIYIPSKNSYLIFINDKNQTLAMKPFIVIYRNGSTVAKSFSLDTIANEAEEKCKHALKTDNPDYTFYCINITSIWSEDAFGSYTPTIVAFVANTFDFNEVYKMRYTHDTDILGSGMDKVYYSYEDEN